MLLYPKDIEITDQAGTVRHYRIGKMPYYPSREICSQFITTAAPKIGNYAENEKLSIKMMGFAAVVTDEGVEILLKTKELVNNHVPDFQTGIKLEAEILDYNAGFSIAGEVRKFRRAWLANFPELITRTLIQLRDSLSQPEKPVSTNSEPSTH